MLLLGFVINAVPVVLNNVKLFAVKKGVNVSADGAANVTLYGLVVVVPSVAVTLTRTSLVVPAETLMVPLEEAPVPITPSTTTLAP